MFRMPTTTIELASLLTCLDALTAPAIVPYVTDELRKYMHYDAAASKAMGVFPSPNRFQLAAALGHGEDSGNSEFSLFSILNKTCTGMGSRMLKRCIRGELRLPWTKYGHTICRRAEVCLALYLFGIAACLDIRLIR